MAGLANRQPATDPGVAARIELAAALRLAARWGLHEGIDNHFSLAVPGTRNRFLLNPYALHAGSSSLVAHDAVHRIAPRS